MKRSLATLIGLAATAVLWAQAPFTIVRPADGSKVREKVRVQIPKGSIPEGSYVGIFVGGKFVEATILDLNGSYYEYVLDTKGRNIPDGKLKLEVVLYAEGGDRPRIVDRSSVDLDVQNVASIPVPEDGFLLRYRFVPNTELTYGIEERTSISTISENQARAGGRAALLPIDSEKFRYLYAIDNRYPDGDGLVRLQPLPAKGKDYAILRTIEATEGKRYYDFEMHPLYMRVTNTGREEFGSIPMYVPLEGTAGEQIRTDLFAVLPLPSLPEKRVKPGDSWQSGIQVGKLDLQNREDVDSVTSKQIARGTLLGVEWEMGHPCAKIKYSIAAGLGGRPTPNAAGAQGGRDQIGDDRVQLEQTFWFAIDKGMVVKSVIDITRDVKIEGAAAGGMAGGGAPIGAGGGGPAAPSGAMGGGGKAGAQGIGFQRRGGGPQRGGGPGGAGVPGPPPGVIPGGGRFGAPGGDGGPLGGAGRQGGGAAAQNQLMRIRQQIILVLEK